VNNFGRVAEFHVKDRIFKYPELEMSFEINFSTKSDGNTGHIKIYNLNDKSIEKLKKDAEFKLKAGYQDDLGLIMLGKIASATTKFEDKDKLTKISLDEDISTLIKVKINKTWAKNTRADIIIRDIINQLPLNLGDLDIVNNQKYRKGKSFSCNAKKALEELAKDTDSKLHISRGKIYFRPEDKGAYRVVKLNKDNGLIASPQRVDSGDKERWKVQSLLRYKIEPDIILDIESLTLNGHYRVVKGKHKGDWTTEVEVVKFAG
jgi:hypothetical protein